jgi:phenylalanyl-tRNA synthetase beta subunit
METSIDKIPKDLFRGSKSYMDKINFIKYQSVSEFPSSTRDFSFSITDFKKYHVVINYLSDLNDKNLKDAFIFDFYENKKVNEIKVGIRFTFQSNFNTLSEDEIQKSVNKLLKPIVDLEGVSIPGL